jgi:hypothetical protein
MKGYEFLDLLTGLQNPTIDTLLQAAPALNSCTQFIKGAASLLSQSEPSEDSVQYKAAIQEYDLALMLIGFAGTALLQLQQQPVLHLLPNQWQSYT